MLADFSVKDRDTKRQRPKRGFHILWRQGSFALLRCFSSLWKWKSLYIEGDLSFSLTFLFFVWFDTTAYLLLLQLKSRFGANGNIADKSRWLSAKEIHFTFWTNTSCNFRQIHFIIWTNIFCNLSNRIWTNTCCLLLLQLKLRVGLVQMATVQMKAVDTVLQSVCSSFCCVCFSNIFCFCIFFVPFKRRFCANGNIADNSRWLSVTPIWLEQRIAESFYIQGETNQIICRCKS